MKANEGKAPKSWMLRQQRSIPGLFTATGDKCEPLDVIEPLTHQVLVEYATIRSTGAERPRHPGVAAALSDHERRKRACEIRQVAQARRKHAVRRAVFVTCRTWGAVNPMESGIPLC